MNKFTDIELIAKIEAVIANCGMTESNFGIVAINDANLLTQLRSGRELRRLTRARVVDCIERLHSEEVDAPDICLATKRGNAKGSRQGSGIPDQGGAT